MTYYPSRLIERVTEPAGEPLSLAEVKSFLRIDGNDEDTLLGELITTARILAEELTGRSLMTQRWKIAYDNNVPQTISLPYGPLQSVISVSVVSEEEVASAVDSGTYHVNANQRELVFETMPWGHRIEIVIETGYGDESSDVPSAIRQGMLVHVANLYEHRDTMSPPLVSHMLYANYREVRL